MRPRPLRPVITLLSLGVLVVPLLSACEAPREPVDPPPTAPVPATPIGPGLTDPYPPPTSLPSPAPSALADEDRAVDCAGRPAAAEVLTLLRSSEVLGRDTEATVSRGPLCAGGWQYAVVDVPDLDPLQVVTRGEPGALELVTAGTDVCTVDVRILAPSGISAAAACVG